MSATAVVTTDKLSSIETPDAPTVLTLKPESGSPYQLNHEQVFRAATALVKHMHDARQLAQASAPKKDLLTEASESDDDGALQSPVWLVVATKKHICDEKRLKPGKIRICLITADPQRAIKDLVADPTFPPELAPRISRVIGISKLRAKYKSYESRRQLLAEHDVFLADDRVVTFLPATLGKVFYHTTAKRPVPVCLTGGAARPAKQPGQPKGRNIIAPRRKGPLEGKLTGAAASVGREIERTLSTALVYLTPGTTTAVRVAVASWTAEKVAANVEAVVAGLAPKMVAGGWRNVRAMYIKGERTVPLPIWLADELWETEADVRETQPAPPQMEASARPQGKKRSSANKAATGPKRVKTGATTSLEQTTRRKELLQQQAVTAMKSASMV